MSMRNYQIQGMRINISSLNLIDSSKEMAVTSCLSVFDVWRERKGKVGG